MRSLEISDWKQKGKELVNEISTVVDREARLMNEVPSRLIMNRKQYNSLVAQDLFLPAFDPGVTKSGIIYSDRLKAAKEQLFLTKGGYPLDVEVNDIPEVGNES